MPLAKPASVDHRLSRSLTRAFSCGRDGSERVGEERCEALHGLVHTRAVVEVHVWLHQLVRSMIRFRTICGVTALAPLADC